MSIFFGRSKPIKLTGPQKKLLNKLSTDRWYGLFGKEYASARKLEDFGLVEFESNRFAPLVACYCKSTLCEKGKFYSKIRLRISSRSVNLSI